MKIYVVTGSWYGADEHEEWIICAYMDEDKAKEHAANAKRRNDEIQNEEAPWCCSRCSKGVPSSDWWGNPTKQRCNATIGFVCPIQMPKNEYDPDGRNYSDTDYSVEAVELVES